MSGTRNTLTDLNNHLFEQMERLNDATDEELKGELQRSKVLSGLSKNIINNGRLMLDAHKFNDDRMDAEKEVPRLLK